MDKHRISIVIRTFNEGRFLANVLTAIDEQDIEGICLETIIVDSGSTDNTLLIAKQYNAKIIQITQDRFSYGYSLNVGFQYASNPDVVVSLSGHCIPKSHYWLKMLIEPIMNDSAALVFGRQDAPGFVRTSERNYFHSKYDSLNPGHVHPMHFNNANSAVKFSVWCDHKFDERIPAQEDIEFAARVHQSGMSIYYEPSAEVMHIHDDTNIMVYKRIVRELHAEIMLDVKQRHEVLLNIFRTPWLMLSDARCAYERCVLGKAIRGIVGFRVMQMCASFVALYKSY